MFSSLIIFFSLNANYLHLIIDIDIDVFGFHDDNRYDQV